MKTANISLSLEFGESNGTMDLSIADESTIIKQVTDGQGHVTLDFPVDFPNTLTLHLSGKGSRDTMVNREGEIISDKYVKLIGLKVGGVPVDHNKLFNICNYEHDGGIYQDVFWGFNGKVDIKFNEPNFIKWHLAIGNTF